MLTTTVRTRGFDHARNALRRVARIVGGGDSRLQQILGTELVRGIRKNIRESHSPAGRPYLPLKWRRGRPLQDTRMLYNSISWMARVRGGVVAGTNRVGAALQNFGGVVRPKRAKMLAIPMNRQVARQYRAGTSIRNQVAFADAFVFRSKKGTLFLARRTGGKRLQLLFILLRSVRIPKREFMGLDNDSWATITKRAEALVKTEWK